MIANESDFANRLKRFLARFPVARGSLGTSTLKIGGYPSHENVRTILRHTVRQELRRGTVAPTTPPIKTRPALMPDAYCYPPCHSPDNHGDEAAARPASSPSGKRDPSAASEAPPPPTPRGRSRVRVPLRVPGRGRRRRPVAVDRTLDGTRADRPSRFCPGSVTRGGRRRRRGESGFRRRACRNESVDIPSRFRARSRQSSHCFDRLRNDHGPGSEDIARRLGIDACPNTFDANRQVSKRES